MSAFVSFHFRMISSGEKRTSKPVCRKGETLRVTRNSRERKGHQSQFVARERLCELLAMKSPASYLQLP
jgi:hypothetical protein